MKILVISILLLALVFIGSFFLYNTIENTANDFASEVIALKELVREENWQEVDVAFEHFKKSWQPKSNIWMAIINHEEIDSIERALVESEQYIYFRDKKLSYVQLSVLEHFLEHIYLKEKVTLQNIF